MKNRLHLILLVCIGCLLQAQDSVKYEAEDVIINPEVVLQGDGALPNAWNFWATDKNAHLWSGRKVIRSPWVKEERKTPEEGAPVLKVRIPVPEDGIYTLTSFPASRVFGLSLDAGKTWQRFHGGNIVTQQKLQKGFFECWFDDCFMEPEPSRRGSAYLDYFILQKMNQENWLKGDDFEAGKLGEFPPQWGWFHRNNIPLQVKLTEQAHEGKQAAHLVCQEAEGDWAFTCRKMRPVKPGECFKISFWGYTHKGSVNPRLTAVVYRDGKVVSWDIGSAGIMKNEQWCQGSGYVEIPENVNQLFLRFASTGKADFIVDDVRLEPIAHMPEPKVMPKVEGWAKKRVVERLGRGVFAQQVPEGAYISWRLLNTEPADFGFDIFRIVGNERQKLNNAPILQTCDWLDTAPVADCFYEVQVSGPMADDFPKGRAQLLPMPEDKSLAYRSYKLKEADKAIQKIAFGDLDGDGEMDFVVKYPRGNVDPWSVVWYASKDTYKLEAFRSTGERLWTKDLGWSIEAGIWYSPYVVYDFNGDGCAEVAVKTGEGDPRDADGRVQDGPEWLTILDGKTGREIARAPWPDRDSFDSYNHASRNLLAVGYVDGKTPCILVMRGTYTAMFAQAWQLNGTKLEQLWAYDNLDLPKKYYGQGAHTNYCVDVDGDGRDEVILGSIVLDDNGAPLWTTGKGHPDGVFFGDILPSHPGPEIGYFMETRNPKDGICLVDAKTGKVLWGLQEKTNHVDGKGTCADVDARYPGCEMAGADMAILEPGTNKRGLLKGWLFTADGTLLTEGKDMYFRFGKQTIWWDADLQKEILNGRSVEDYRGCATEGKFQGNFVQACDVIGDWREEIITTLDGEFRVYSTPIPAMDRRRCLMQCHNYRMRQASNSMGYTTEALLDYDLETKAPNLNLTLLKDTSTLEVVVVASALASLKGQLKLTPPDGLHLSITDIPIDLKPGERMVTEVKCSYDKPVDGRINATLETNEGPVLKNRVTVRKRSPMDLKGYVAEAEAFVAQSGGEVQIRKDKPGVHGQAFSHWDNKGHRLAWDIAVPKDGDYRLIVRYSCREASQRQLWLNGQDHGILTFPTTWGFGDSADDWSSLTVKAADGKPLRLRLQAGKCRIELENADGRGTNLDYLLLQPYDGK